MKLRLIAMLVALPALVAGLLVMSPAEALTHYTYVSTKYVTMTSISETGMGGKVSVSCHGSNRCRGTLYFEGSENRARSYSLKGNSRATISVTMNKSSQFNPATHGTPKGISGQYKAVPNVKLMVNEAAPKNLSPFYYRVQTETRSPGRIYYSVNGNAAGLTDLRIELHRALRGGNTELVASRSITGSTSSYFSSSLGANNTPGPSYKMKLRAKDANGRQLEWWWRGSSGNTAGGSRYLREANTVRSTKDGFDADVYWGTISGAAPAGQDVRVLAPPASFSGGTVVRRELDVPSCANIFGEDTANSGGTYAVPFLPYDNAGPKNYMVTTKVSGDQVWLGGSGQHFGSCHSALDYRFSRSNLIALSSGALGGQNITSLPPRKTTNIKARFSGYNPTGFDEYVRIREKVPGLAVLDTPVVVQGGTGADHEKAFALPYGQYWVEVGRRTGCSTWYPSRYSNNKAYFNGADRGAEAWKSFSTLASLPGNSSSGLERVAIAYGATYAKQGKRPSGYAGWMYRGYCKALGEGTVNSMTVSSTSAATKTTSVNDKGAIVKGRVTRTGGRTNKEMMVRLSSSGGTVVLRTDYTDGGGYFYVAGLASGTYTISVNSDSWRGIGRTFTGKHSIKVSRGKVYNAGTLRFSG